METFAALLALYVGNSSVTGEFPSQRPVKQSLDIFFDLSLNKRLNKQSRRWRFETPSRSLWRHCNEVIERANLFYITLHSTEQGLHTSAQTCDCQCLPTYCLCGTVAKSIPLGDGWGWKWITTFFCRFLNPLAPGICCNKSKSTLSKLMIQKLYCVLPAKLTSGEWHRKSLMINQDWCR